MVQWRRDGRDSLCLVLAIVHRSIDWSTTEVAIKPSSSTDRQRSVQSAELAQPAPMRFLHGRAPADRCGRLHQEPLRRQRLTPKSMDGKAEDVVAESVE